MTEEEIMALMAMLSEGGGGGDPYAEMYAPQGLPFIPQKTNTRGETDMNAAFNAMQDWIQMQSDPIMNAMLSAQTGVPLVDYNQQAPQEPIYTPTLDSLRSSTNEVLRGVAEGIEAGRSPFEIEAEMRAAGADPDTIDMATRAADAAFQEFGDFQRVSAENAQAQSPLDEAYAEAGLPSPLARYGDPGYEHEDMPTEMRRQDQDVLGRFDAQLEAIRRQAAGQQGRPEYTPTGSVWRQGGNEMDSPEMQAFLLARPEVVERTAEGARGRVVNDAYDEMYDDREQNRQVMDELAGIERDDPFAPQPGDPGYGTGPSSGGGITGSIAPGLGSERRAEPQAPQGPRWGNWGNGSLSALERLFGEGERQSPRGGAQWPGDARDRRAPTRAAQPSSSQRYANAVRQRAGGAYSAASRAKVVQRNRDNLDRRYTDRLSTSRRVIADILAAQGRSPLNDAVNARQALLRQTFGI